MTDFFKIDIYNISSAAVFGLCCNGTLAYSYLDEKNKDEWVIQVNNPDQEERKFVPIKGCLVLDKTVEEDLDLCDGFIIYTDNIIFVGLYHSDDDIHSLIDENSQKLKNTIKIFRNNHNIDNYQCRIAHIGYRRQLLFAFSQTNIKNKFAQETGIQLLIDSKIDV